VISVVVLVDVVEQNDELERGSRRALCVSVGDDIETPSQEPDPRLVTMLRERLQNVYPLSECRVTAEGVTHVSNGGKAVLLGVALPIWERNDFVKIKAWRFYNAFNATSWTYTLNREKDLWRIGVVKLGKVAASDDGTRSPTAS
jgi:hypothetical protein